MKRGKMGKKKVERRRQRYGVEGKRWGKIKGHMKEKKRARKGDRKFLNGVFGY